MELLVVVAIIGVLASLLLPALSKAREKGKQAVCQSNLRQIGQAGYMYAGDFNWHLPKGPPLGALPAQSGIYNTTYGAQNHGLYYFLNYSKSLGVYFCNSANFYTINGVGVAQNFGSAGVYSSFICRNDSGGSTNANFDWFLPETSWTLDNNRLFNFDRYSHKMEFVNILGGDGHVKGTPDTTQGSYSLGNNDQIFYWAYGILKK